MNDKTQIWLAAAVLALAGVVTAPAFSAAMASQFTASTKAGKIAIEAPVAPGALGTIWFDTTEDSGLSFGGQR